MLTRNHKSGTYLNSMHILVVFFLYYISHLCPQPYAAGLGPTVLILGIRGLCWIIDWCGNSWVNEKLEDIQCSGVRVNRPGLGEATLGVCVSVPLCTASFETFIKCKWSSTGKELLKNVLALSLKEEKHYIPAAQGCQKVWKFQQSSFFKALLKPQCLWPKHPVAHEYAELVYLQRNVALACLDITPIVGNSFPLSNSRLVTFF